MSFIKVPLGLKPPKPSSEQIAAGKRHMARVARLPCVICGGRPVQIHHCIHGRYGQRKVSDFETIPLCPDHHQIGPYAIHNDKAGWLDRWGADHSYLAVVADALAGDLTP